ncbi:MAG: RluA family pseudouridine synthase [Faecalibacterium sp.]
MELLYQDNAIIVCVKPIGADSEDGKPNCMPALLRAALGLADDAPIYTVHRLDKQVSGVMVYAKTKQAAAVLSTQMQQHQFTKEYRAVVEGILSQPLQTENTPPLPSGRWEDLLYHDKRKNKVFAVKKERKGVKHAALRYQVLGQIAMAATPALAQNLTLLEIALETGRTHQIRVQCASRKLPLVGDSRYGSKTKGCDIALFSHKIAFYHPITKEFVSFTKEVPETLPWCLF